MDNNERNGIGVCGVCRICTCIRWSVLTTTTGATKITQIVIKKNNENNNKVFSALLQTLLLAFGVPYAKELGISFALLLTVSSACLMTTTTLLLVYVTSKPSMTFIKASSYEWLFNVLAASMYTGGALGLAVRVHASLFYYYTTIPGFHAYPAMTAAYVLALFVALVHGCDAVLSFRSYRRAKRRRQGRH